MTFTYPQAVRFATFDNGNQLFELRDGAFLTQILNFFWAVAKFGKDNISVFPEIWCSFIEDLGGATKTPSRAGATDPADDGILVLWNRVACDGLRMSVNLRPRNDWAGSDVVLTKDG